MGATAGRVAVALPTAAAAEYEVVVRPGALEVLPEVLRDLCPAHRYAILTDDRVERLYGPAVRDALRSAALDAELFSFPAGEAHKTRGSWVALTDRMLAAGLGRDAAVVALGGGVVGDLAGFVAATYLRGIPYVQVPTTLLAMIDASVGGKTGVDTPAGKNLVGAFHQPRAVIADPEVLRTLAPEHLRAGLAEAVKHGAIADREYYDWIGARAADLTGSGIVALAELVLRSVRIKAEFVARDEREAGPRKLLNFGHTIGHAIEAVSGYRVLHGEAVAIGMVVEARVGELAGVTESGTAERLRELLGRLGLPISVPVDLDRNAILDATCTDKKARAGRVEYALIRRIGEGAVSAEGRWGWAVGDDPVREGIRG